MKKKKKNNVFAYLSDAVKSLLVEGCGVEPAEEIRVVGLVVGGKKKGRKERC